MDWLLYTIIIISSIAVALALVSLFLAKFRKRQRKEASPNANSDVPLALIETDEAKVVKLINAQGGSVFQSDIAEQLKFSKAKTSQLLTTLEKKGVVRRYKKGRDKIVTLTEQSRSDSL